MISGAASEERPPRPQANPLRYSQKFYSSPLAEA